ncbi:AraC family transcriptional regulator [Rhodococcus sp. D2-41]|uniref:AraC family transcriptional regulator n=1 Tax=Speluncibacter jeojiensis TaxID=2710754 RepID=A0A9X4M7Z1_9ACTN|nr:AraC family transcriptional regulator [Rhodococcus sp. D2-41]MDG3009419.1 AraC family transcriptional regulator [Rhodococcus sp. D2-41]MDG3016953.1 AraC family transcriptional regulator [Corynebacteriales bacterium D3-21]
MDALVGFLDGPRARGAFLLRSVLDPPWSLWIKDEAPLTIAAVVRGTAWVRYEGDDPRPLHPGDVAIMRGPDHYIVADSPDTAPQVIIGPGQVCTTVEGVTVAESMSQGVRTWGNTAQGATVMLTGTYSGDGVISRRLVDVLPRLIVMCDGQWDCPVIPLLADEIGKDEPGQEAVLDRLLDLLVVAALRAWLSRPDADAPAWYRAHADPVAGRALRLLQNNPEQPWTVAALAGEVGVSRAALARRFSTLVGEPPMAFLTGWRLTLAADLLLEPNATVASVARKVGYGSPFTFSTAFKRHHGCSPQTHRSTRLDDFRVPASS